MREFPSNDTPARVPRLRVLVAAGGTAGHLAPAIAVADELRAAGHDVSFAASRGRRDEELVSSAGYDAELFAISGLPRRPGVAQLRAIGQAIGAVFSSLRIVRRQRPDVVLAAGGFVSAPVAIAAKAMRVPVVATEADAHLGLANRISGRMSRRLCTAYPLPNLRMRQEVTGRPVSRRFVELGGGCERIRRDARAQLEIPLDGRVLLVFGGSGGATRLNESTHDAWGSDPDPRIDGEPLWIVHVSGHRDHADVAQRGIASNRYRLLEYSDDMPTLIAAADLVVCRPGGSVFELAAIGRAAVLVPSPHVTGDHQAANARWFVEQGAAAIADDSSIHAATLRSIVHDLLAASGDERRHALERAMRDVARPRAAGRIATIVAQCGAARVRRRAGVDANEAPPAPLAGRSFHLMGIGGAGVSALAVACQAWGARVSGCDQADSGFAQLVRDAGIDVAIGHDPSHVHEDVELVASSALPADHPELARARELGCRTWLRGELLGELTRLRPETIVVAGAHGKSTTTGMLMHAALALDLDPAAVLGATVPIGPDTPPTNVLTGSGPFLVEGDESDRTLLHLAPRVAVVTNIERDHHHTFASDEEVERLFARWVNEQRPDVLVAGPGAALDRLVAATSGSGARVIRFGDDEDELRRVGSRLASPGRHNALNALAAMHALGSVPSARDLSQETILDALADFRGVGRRFEVHGEAHGVLVVDDYAHHPTEVAATIEAARSQAAARGGRVLVVFQPHLYSRTRSLAGEFAAALAHADRAWVLPIYGAREAPMVGVTERLIADPLVEIAPSVYAGRGVDDPATGDVATILSETMNGDVLITMGAGNVTALAPRLLDGLEDGLVDAPSGVERDVDLARATTIGTGGTARFFARVDSQQQLVELLAWARESALPVVAIGLGTSMIVADEGFSGLAIRLVGDLARIDVDAARARVVIGGGAMLAAALDPCREAGIGGIEFAAAIPGTAGAALATNAEVDGSSIREALLRARLASASGTRDVVPADLSARSSHASIGPNEVVCELELALASDERVSITARIDAIRARFDESHARSTSASVPALRRVFLDPKDGPRAAGLVEQAGMGGLQIGGARISSTDCNVIENVDDATSSDVIALAEAMRDRVRTQFGVELQSAVRVIARGGSSPLFEHGDAPAGAGR